MEKVEGKILLLAHADLTKDHCDPRGRGKYLEILKGSVAHKRTFIKFFLQKNNNFKYKKGHRRCKMFRKETYQSLEWGKKR